MHIQIEPSLRFSQTPRLINGARDHGYARLWDVRSYKKRAELPVRPRDASFEDIAFSPGGRTLAGAANVGGDGAVLLWDPRSHRQLSVNRLHNPIETVAFSPSGRTPENLRTGHVRRPSGK